MRRARALRWRLEDTMRTTIHRAGTYRVSRTSSVDPFQLVALLLGLVLVVVGGIALVRSGLPADLTGPRARVLGLPHTPLLGILEFALGLVFLGLGAFPGGGGPAMTFLGSLLLAFGLLVTVEPAAFEAALGVTRTNGWFFVSVGVASLSAGLVGSAGRGRRHEIEAGEGIEEGAGHRGRDLL